MRKPDFDNLLAVLNHEKPKRPTLFEFFMCESFYEKVTGIKLNRDTAPELELTIRVIKAFEKMGYDYATVRCSFNFPQAEQASSGTMSLNEGLMITDRKSFEEYPWPDVEKYDYSILEKLVPHVPEGMKLLTCGPSGVLENVIKLIGFDNLCFMSIDNQELLHDICDAVGSRLTKHYEISSKYDIVGVVAANDDWGFKTQTMLSPDDMRKYIIPWHCKISEVIHSSGKPAILHSCGNLEYVMDDIIDVIKFQGLHSYEDAICPIEEAYEKWGERIAVLGGIDMDFLCRKSPQAVHERSKKMLERAADRGSYALGSGNSIPEYVPYENYIAMTTAATG